MNAWLHTRTINDLAGTSTEHPPVQVCGDPQHLMDIFGNTHPEYVRRGDTWVRTRPHRMNPDGTPDHDRTTMTTIKDLELRIKSAESTLEMLRGELEELRQQQQQKPEPESLFGRWATHKEFGRGIIISDKPDSDGDVRFAYRNSSYTDHVDTRFVLPESLTIDLATLTTTEDFDNAPEGTIVEGTMPPKAVAVKTEDGWYRTGGMHAIAVEYMPTCRVIRWGENK